MPYYRRPYRTFRRFRRYRRSKYPKRFDKSARTFYQKTGSRTVSEQTVVNKTFVSHTVNFPPYGSAINGRDTQIIYVHGLDICFTFHNSDVNNNQNVIEPHFALIQLKNQDSLEDGTIYRDFFRDFDAGSVDRGLDFQNLAINNAWDSRYLCNPINSQKFNVIFHKKFWLGSDHNISSSFSMEQSRWMKKVELYVPIKKRFTFDDTADNHPVNPLLFVIWWMHPAQHQHSTDGSDDSLCYTFNYNVVWKGISR